jgi:nitrite reductase/ring-hydroxylating ferredoxin subunit
MMWTSLCQLSDLREDEGKYVEIDGFCLAVFLHQGKIHVLDNHCPHAGANLAGGHIDQGCVVCPKHSWPFRLEDGQLRDTPGVNVDIYPVRLLEREGLPTLVQIQLPIH